MFIFGFRETTRHFLVRFYLLSSTALSSARAIFERRGSYFVNVFYSIRNVNVKPSILCVAFRWSLRELRRESSVMVLLCGTVTMFRSCTERMKAHLFWLFSQCSFWIFNQSLSCLERLVLVLSWTYLVVVVRDCIHWMRMGRCVRRIVKFVVRERVPREVEKSVSYKRTLINGRECWTENIRV